MIPWGKKEKEKIVDKDHQDSSFENKDSDQKNIIEYFVTDKEDFKKYTHKYDKLWSFLTESNFSKRSFAMTFVTFGLLFISIDMALMAAFMWLFAMIAKDTTVAILDGKISRELAKDVREKYLDKALKKYGLTQIHDRHIKDDVQIAYFVHGLPLIVKNTKTGEDICLVNENFDQIKSIRQSDYYRKNYRMVVATTKDKNASMNNLEPVFKDYLTGAELQIVDNYSDGEYNSLVSSDDVTQNRIDDTFTKIFNNEFDKINEVSESIDETDEKVDKDLNKEVSENIDKLVGRNSRYVNDVDSELKNLWDNDNEVNVFENISDIEDEREEAEIAQVKEA